MREMEVDYMIKSKERTTEYCVIVQPRHREHSPICYKGYAKDEEEAQEFKKFVQSIKPSDFEKLMKNNDHHESDQ